MEGGDVIHIFPCKKIKAIFTLYWITFCAGAKIIPDSSSLLLTQVHCKKGEFGAISVVARSCTAPISKLESHIWDK